MLKLRTMARKLALVVGVVGADAGGAMKAGRMLMAKLLAVATPKHARRSTVSLASRVRLQAADSRRPIYFD